MTAAVGLYSNLQLPLPWQPATASIPTIIYGASSAVGAFAVKLANRSNIHLLIIIAGNGKEYVESLLDRSRGDCVIDYRQGTSHLIREVQVALKRVGLAEVRYAFDAISEHGSFQTLSKVLESGGHITVVRPEEDYAAISPDILTSMTYVGMVHTGPLPLVKLKSIRYEAATRGKEFGLVFFRLFGQGLSDGWFRGHPFHVVTGGLSGIQAALSNLRQGKASAVKYVVRIQDIP